MKTPALHPSLHEYRTATTFRDPKLGLFRTCTMGTRGERRSGEKCSQALGRANGRTFNLTPRGRPYPEETEHQEACCGGEAREQDHDGGCGSRHHRVDPCHERRQSISKRRDARREGTGTVSSRRQRVRSRNSSNTRSVHDPSQLQGLDARLPERAACTR